MEGFDPDQYLKEKEMPQASPQAFDPDQYLKEKEPPMTATERLAKTGVTMLPGAMGVAGGALGTLVEPGVGTYAGAMGGAAIGRNIQDYLEERQSGKPKSLTEKARNMAIAAGDAALTEFVAPAKLIGGGIKAVSKLAGKPLEAAAEKIGSEVGQKALSKGISKSITMKLASINPALTLAEPAIEKYVAPTATKLATKSTEGAARLFMYGIPKYATMAAENPELFNATVQTYLNQNITPIPEKGPEKWKADGYHNLVEHGADLDMLGKAKADPANQGLFEKASDLKAGSKAMDKIESQLEDKTKEKK